MTSEIERLRRSIIDLRTSWDNRCLYILRFHESMQAERGIGKPKSQHGWSLRDTATELEIKLATLHRDIECAKLLPSFPMLRRRCRSANDFLSEIYKASKKSQEG